MKKSILITAGEASGDIHAANLVKNLRKLKPDIYFFGIGRKKMEAEGVDLLENMERLSIIGVSGILSNLKRIRSIYKKIMGAVEKNPPDAAILVDYPGFNLILARALKKRGIRVIYYITPQVWAWGKFRIHAIKKFIDKAMVILRFEEELFKSYGIDATFVGHPLLDVEKKESLDRKSCGLDEQKQTIALLPGSRNSEVKDILPMMLETAGLILKSKNVQFVLLKSSNVGEDIYSKILEKSHIPLAVIKDNTCGCLSISDFAFTSSGTATLEGAIAEKPMVITYRTTFLTFLLFKIFATTRLIGLVNIIAKKAIVPEILQYNAKPKTLASGILAIISSREKMDEQIQNLRWVKRALGTPGASLRAARIVKDFITERR